MMVVPEAFGIPCGGPATSLSSIMGWAALFGPGTRTAGASA
jgi:hypothetical protein